MSDDYKAGLRDYVSRHVADRQTMNRPSLCLDYPLTPDYMVQLVLPRDLSQHEADKLCALIQTLVAPWTDAARREET